MNVTLEKTFPMPGSAQTAWALLQDIKGVASCMPGARITERSDAQHYKGTVAVKFGPANMAFRGDVEVRGIEPATKTLRVFGKGTDTTGSSGASMDLTARIDAVDAASCNLVGTSEVSMSGKAASFGGRMMNSVADQVLNQFAANFAAQVQAMQAQAQAPDAALPDRDHRELPQPILTERPEAHRGRGKASRRARDPRNQHHGGRLSRTGAAGAVHRPGRPHGHPGRAQPQEH